MRHVRLISTTALAVALLLPLKANADDLGKQWWVRDAQEQAKTQQTSSSDETVVVPGYFAEQPKPFERPAEIIVPNTPSYGGSLLGSPFGAYRTPLLGAPVAGVPFTGLGTVPYIGSGVPFVGSGIPYVGSIPYVSSSIPYVGSQLPYIGSIPYRGFGGFGLNIGGLGVGSLGLGGLPYGGYAPGIGGLGPYGVGGLGPYGGVPFGGYGGYGAWNPAGSALFMGAMGNKYGLNNSKLGQVGTNKVIQTAPSKASGNYYAPSNVDTSAAGSYYATTAPAMIPYMKPKKAPDSYWGGGGSPFKDVNLNSTPWNK